MQMTLNAFIKKANAIIINKKILTPMPMVIERENRVVLARKWFLSSMFRD